jgi:ABC-type glutathione transport system ATPase component
MLITHDMGVIAETCDRVAVMYAGRIAEIGPVHDVINQPGPPLHRGPDGLHSRHDARPRTPEPDRRCHAAPECHPPGCAYNPRCPKPLTAAPRAPRPDGRRRHPRRLLAAHEVPHEGVPYATRPLVQAHDLAKTFDVSAPWLNRVIERKPRTLLHAVDGVSFEIERARRWPWWVNPAAAKARWRACWWACTSPRAAA